MLSTEMIVSMMVLAVASLTWLLRLEGRVNTQQALHDRMASDLQYVRDRIDSVLVERRRSNVPDRREFP